MLYDAYGKPIAPNAGSSVLVEALQDDPRWARVQPGQNDLRRNLRQQVVQDLRAYLEAVTTHPIEHATTVASGWDEFREVVIKALGAYYGANRHFCRELAQQAWIFLRETWRDLHPTVTPRAFLDRVQVAIPKTEAEVQAEIDDAWELDIASDERSMRQHYEGSARERRGADVFRSGFIKGQP